MKTFTFFIFLLASFSLYSQTDFSARLIPGSNILSISIADDGLFPPFEGGDFWNAMKGNEQRKYVEAQGFSLECDALKNNQNEVFASCLINMPISLMQKIGDVWVYKLKGAKARMLNQFFVDSAYVAIQRNGVYLSSYNTRSEFYFGIKEGLIK